MIKSGILHCHTQHSIRDSVVTVEALCTRAKEMGATAVAIADHGVLTGIPSFLKAAKANDIKAIAGIEFYVKENEYDERLHLIVYAKDKIGYKAMMKAVKLSNKRIEKKGTLIFPAVNKEILETCFGPDSEGHGHVIATSACVGGVLAGLNFQNQKYSGMIEELERQTKQYREVFDLLAAHKEKLTQVEHEIAKILPIAEKKYSKSKREVNKITDDVEKAEMLCKIAKEESETEAAKEKLAQLKKIRTTIGKQITICKNKLPQENSVVEEREKMLQKLRGTVKSRVELIELMEKEAVRYETMFGKGNFFIELQFHGIPAEKEFMFALDRIAEKLDIPTVAANDAHMLGNSEEDILGRETITSLRFTKLEPLEPSDHELYLKDDEALEKALCGIVAPGRAKIAMDNISLIVSECNYVPDEKPQHYPVFDKSKDSFQLLKKLAYAGIEKRFPGGFPSDEYQKRLEYELDVMKKMNVSDYHLIVQDLLNFAKKLGKMPKERYKHLAANIWQMSYGEILTYVEEDLSYVGYVTGPGRGSAAGSLVCYLLGITDLDPLKYNLLFERYLNPERVTMPDIDSDYANGYRETVIAYTYKKYGMDAVCRIITFSTSAAKSSIKEVAKAIGNTKANLIYKDTAEKDGPVDYVMSPALKKASGKMNEYTVLGEMLADVIPKKPNEKIETYLDIYKDMAAKDKRVEDIIARALSVEGVYHHYGMHAAGVIISDNDNVNDYVPLSWDDGNNQWKCQCDMVEAEEQGLLKMDFLGLKNLNIITEILRLIYERTGQMIDPNTDIKEESKVIKAICASGDTNAIFQLESEGIKDVERKMAPDKFEDLILLLAAYRPGPMESIPSMINVKRGAKAEYRHPMLEPILNVTYGSLIYQEQVQQIFRELAGYSFGRADLVRRAMSKKKEKVFLAEKPIFVHGKPEEGICGCVQNGIPAETAEAIFDDMVDFAKYAFNKSHAAAYARVTYILAWLKYYYPLEFMTVAMNWASEKQLVRLVADAKDRNMEVLPVDINRSGEKFTIVDGKILFGLTSIKGIGGAEPILEARKVAAFTDFKDYLRRGHFKKDVTEKLIDAGAFDCFCKNRKALSMAFAEVLEILDTKKKTDANIDKERLILDTLLKLQEEKNSVDGFGESYIRAKLKEAGYKGKSILTVEKQQEKLQKLLDKEQEFEAQLNEIEIPTYIDEDIQEKLAKEKALIGVYVSGHPMDAYKVPGNCQPISEMQGGQRVNVCGIISDFVIRQRKSDNKDMGFFTLEDKSGIIDICCFTKEYEEYGELLAEGKVVQISGRVMEEEVYSRNDDDAEDNEEKEVILKIKVQQVREMYPAEKSVCIEIDSIMDWEEIERNKIIPYVQEKGKYRLLLHDRLFNEVRETNLRVNAEILTVPGYRERAVLF